MNQIQALQSRRYRILLAWRYMEVGIAKTAPVKYLLAYVSLASMDVRLAAMLGVGYALGSFALGLWWFKSKTVEIENEVSNQFNILAKEIRRSIKK